MGLQNLGGRVASTKVFVSALLVSVCEARRCCRAGVPPWYPGQHHDQAAVTQNQYVLMTQRSSSHCFSHVSGAHIDCERSKGFVQYRWYSTELSLLSDDLSASDTENKKVVGCCCLGHWKRKPPGRETSKTTSHLLVSSAIDIENVTAHGFFRKHSVCFELLYFRPCASTGWFFVVVFRFFFRFDGPTLDAGSQPF